MNIGISNALSISLPLPPPLPLLSTGDSLLSCATHKYEVADSYARLQRNGYVLRIAVVIWLVNVE